MAEDEIVVVELEKSKPLIHWIFHDLSAKASENQRVYLFVPEEDRALLFHFLSERWGTEKTGKMPFLWQWGEDPDEKLGEGAVYNKTTGFITTDKATWENFEAYKTAKTLGTVEAINEYFRKYPQGPKTGVKQRLPWQSWIPYRRYFSWAREKAEKEAEAVRTMGYEVKIVKEDDMWQIYIRKS